jgi:predicted dehydrogenase
LSGAGGSEVVRCGFIGLGTEGCNLLRFLTTIPQGRCVALCDIYPPNLKKGMETLGTHSDTYDDHRRLLERKDVDAVVIATPLHLHAPMLLDALAAGKHVFVEKTLFFKEEEDEQIRQAAAAHPKQVLQVGLQRRSSRLFQKAIEMVREGALGKVLHVRSHVATNNSWRRPVVTAEYERQINWRMYREYSGGLVAEMGSHAIDTADWVFDAEPVSVIGTGGVDYWQDGREVHDNVHVIFDYPGGARHSFYSLLYNGHPSTKQLVMGDLGTLDLTDDRGIYFREPVAKISAGPAKENWWAGSTVAKQAVKKGIPIIPDSEVKEGGFLERELHYAKNWAASMGIYRYEEPFDPYWGHLVNFFASIQEGKPVIAPRAAGAANSLAVIYANRAIDRGQKVYWPKKSA